MVHSPRIARLACLSLLFLLATVSVFAQQTGSISGKVTATDGSTLPGVTVEASSNVLPTPRVTVSSENGDYRLPALPPGTYTVTFNLAGMDTRTRSVQVFLGQDALLNAQLGVAGVAESITVTASSTLVDPDSTELTTAVESQSIEELPVGQDYRDLIKLAPAVQYTEDTIRGPSAGGSGQDNTYLFDGVNVTLPLFGTLSAEPSSHDIDQIEVVKGGAKAVDFNRSAGFTIDSVSKSGTNEYKGEVGLILQPSELRGDPHPLAVEAQYEQDRTWLTANFGGPILKEKLFFYGSYYRPEVERYDRINSYGAVPDYDSTRNEYFAKLTATPFSSLLLNGSYRTSDRHVTNASVGINSAASTALDEEATQDIGILEASWIVNDRSYATFNYTDFTSEGGSVPNSVLDIVPTTAPGTRLDINNLEQYGLFTVPGLRTANNPTNIAFNQFVQPIIDRYGYVLNGVRTGGGEVGSGSQFNENDFFRKSAQFGYNYTLGTTLAHDLHVGYMWSQDEEDLRRISNGWGSLLVTAGTVNFTPPGGTATPVFYQATFIRSLLGTGTSNNIHSEYVTHNIEVNDTMRWNNWSFNVGLIASQDTLYGQGLREDSSTVSGYVLSPGSKYEMYEIPWEKTLQPRLGTTWAYNGIDNVYASYARYVPAVSSLPRAAAWDRAILGLTTRVHFDATGTIIGSEAVGGSAGKLFVEDLDPRTTDEYLIGTTQQIHPRWSARVYGRYRHSTNFWEDTQNNAREQWAPAGYPKTLYIENLIAQLNQINGVTNSNNNAYVIAQLDGAFTKQYEATVETDWRGDRAFVKGSYTWGHYYGNFDQDNTSLDLNDSSIFVGSSALADGPGRQIWDNKYGDLRGDRRHQLKLYGSYALPWNGTVGAFAIYQSGQPWEAWNYEIYRNLPLFGTSTSDQARYAEPAGSRRTDGHYQMDLTYTQNIPFLNNYNLQFQLDAFNLADNQTGYNPEPSVHRTTGLKPFGTDRDFFDQRRFQAAVRLQF
ncbi:MAG TPA: TonB-dependent receptor [Thermoanaerobaculia bacterium]|nr:TonB-dependent receptor [Thermoanaerobaculia bacterium]